MYYVRQSLRVQVLGLVYRVQVLDSGFMVHFQDSGFSFRIQGLGFRTFESQIYKENEHVCTCIYSAHTPLSYKFVYVYIYMYICMYI